MTVRFYLLPVDRQVIGGVAYRGPKYFAWRFNPDGLNDRWSWHDYGSIDWAVLCSDITSAHHTALIANADVLALPINLDQNLTAGAVTTARDWLENAHLPGNWVSTADTYRGVLRVTTNVIRYIQAVDTDYSLHQISFNLDATVGSLSDTWRERLRSAAESFGLDYSSVTASTTIRQLLKGIADQMVNIPIQFGSLAIL